MALVIYSLYGFAIFFFAGWLFVWLMHLMAIFNGKMKLHKKTQALNPEIPLPGVSIIKPLVGIDPNLSSNLESFFTMKYSLFELLFCVHDEKDPSIKIVMALIEKYPHIDAKLFINNVKVGVNPKINNMQPGYEAAKYDLILISDSGIKMREDTLLDMVLTMKEDVALVHQMPFTCDKKGFPSTLEKVYFGTAHARIYLSADFVGINCPTGMSALMRKKLLDDVGGIRAFGQYLAEDFFFAKSFTDRGWKIKISSQPAWQNCELHDIESFQNRIARWAKLRFAMVPWTILFEPVSECLALGVLAAWSLNFLFQVDPFAVYLFHMLSWFLLDYVLLCIVQNGSLPFTKTDFVIAWLFRETFAYVLFSRALLYPEIKWRTGTYRLKWGGTAEEIKTKL
ncbi:ceramide glucosyltransferase-like protein [Dinothrombium tinctorium]|uniref:ceramide glucosyltransferase n=1 Tax=Dinothrombium tinctorium TaxID=1965070 RepID=A0A3S3QD11_9ACAR|nr:ceramide glucosyltransferase-like protein [Dinothrombium tinctorium]RWS09995.1 ceramide glucosyltransferase-like protein [Dinothrombium tinctorium]